MTKPLYYHLVILGAEAVATLSNRVSQISVQTRFMVDHDTWPPVGTTSFTPLLLNRSLYLNCYHDDKTLEKTIEMAELMYAGDIEKVPSVTKEIVEILAPLEKGTQSCFILIEGAPGIGKSALLKEIHYKWAKKELLKEFKLVLLVNLRDPTVQHIHTIEDLLTLFYQHIKNKTEIVSACFYYLLVTEGRSLTLLLDGYDEYPECLRQSSLIASIIRRTVLPRCGLVVSSRPHASACLRSMADIRIDILGFTKTEREHCIEQALLNQPSTIKELTQYLHEQPSVDSICSIPLNMVSLLNLCKHGIALPKNFTKLYHYFICSAIFRHCSKSGKYLRRDITDLTDLPEPYNRIIQQLSKLSLEALLVDKLIFTLHDVIGFCPDIQAINGAIDGFGLLHAVENFETMKLKFIHFTIQEFLAAHYISYLPPNEEFKVIEATCWSEIHFNMFTMYILLTKGQRPSFKAFLSGGKQPFSRIFLSGRNKPTAIAEKFLKDQLKCLRLYRYFNGAEDYEMCERIEEAETFKGKEINLRWTRLTTSNIKCISLFLTSSINKEWKVLDLYNCHIQDVGMNILYHGLHSNSNISIDYLGLNFNSLMIQSSSFISELTLKLKVKGLGINGNKAIGEDKHLYSMLTNPCNELEELYMMDTNLSSRGARELFTAVKENNKLKELYIDNNIISDDACDVITTALKKNNCLVTLSMYGNPLSSEAIINIVQCLAVNNTLQFLWLPGFPQDFQENITSLQEVVNKKRESQGCQVKLKIRYKYLVK